MMKFFFALLISFIYAAELSKLEGETIKGVITSGFNQLDYDTFYCIVIFLSAEEVLDLKILNQRIYRMVRKLWPEMELSAIGNLCSTNRPVQFSHILKIGGAKRFEDHAYTYTRAQLSCLREFSFHSVNMCKSQAMIDLLPKYSLTTLKLFNLGPTYLSINKIDFPKLTHLELGINISLNHDTFSSLTNCMRVLKLMRISIDVTVASSLAMALKTMDKLEVLSFQYCNFSIDSLSVIFRNLPTSLKSLNISYVTLSDFDKNLFESSLIGLNEMTRLEEIKFWMENNELVVGIILNLPKCIVNIGCQMNRENLNAFQQRSSRFKNVKNIDLFWFMSPPEFIQSIREIFPNLDEDIKKELKEL